MRSGENDSRTKAFTVTDSGSLDRTTIEGLFEWTRLRAAYHEAGHAVVCWAFGVKIVHVRTNLDSGEVDHESQASLAMRLDDRTLHRTLAMISLGGWRAQ